MLRDYCSKCAHYRWKEQECKQKLEKCRIQQTAGKGPVQARHTAASDFATYWVAALVRVNRSRITVLC